MANDENSSGEPTGIIRDHLANERTLLAWTRTALAAAALGFVIAKLHLRVIEGLAPRHPTFSTWAGATFVLVAFLMQIIGIWRYIDLRVRLRGHPFRPLGWAMMILSMGLAGSILALFAYLIVTPA